MPGKTRLPASTAASSGVGSGERSRARDLRYERDQLRRRHRRRCDARVTLCRAPRTRLSLSGSPGRFSTKRLGVELGDGNAARRGGRLRHGEICGGRERAVKGWWILCRAVGLPRWTRTHLPSDRNGDSRRGPRDPGRLHGGRALPSAQHSLVGPFVFFDHMGPVDFPPGTGIDVRPHPHIGLATVTYLFDGEIMHRDSLGSQQAIRPGEVNWMTAGRGITHSERFERARLEGGLLHGIQAWVALPAEQEESRAGLLPPRGCGSADVRNRRPVGTADRRRGLRCTGQGTHAFADVLRSLAPRAGGQGAAAGRVFRAGRLRREQAPSRSTASASAPARCWCLRPGKPVLFTGVERGHVMLLGGEPVGERIVEWNFVSSSKQRIELAKRAWQERRFPTVPGDEVEFIPLP